MKKRRLKWLSYVLLFVLTFTGIVGNFSLNDDASVVHAAGLVDMHRMYNPNSGEHFYTANEAERDNLVSVGWSYEGLGWTAPDTSNTPVYRVYNPNSGEHHYTTNAAEKDMLVGLGWNDEGIGWYSDDSQAVPLYRLYNPNATGEQEAGGHHYTTSVEERDMLVSIGWNDEGIGWYGAVASSPINWNIPEQEGVTSNFSKTDYDYSDLVVEKEVTDSQIRAVTTSGDSINVLLDGSVNKTGIAPGKVLVVATGNMSQGAALKITAVDTLPNGELSVTGVEPELYEVFDSLDLEGNVTAGAAAFTPADGVVVTSQKSGKKGTSVNAIKGEGTYEISKGNVTAKLTLAKMEAHVDIDGAYDAIQNRYNFKSAEVTVTQGVEASLEASYGVKDENLYFKLGEYSFPLGETPFFIGVEVGLQGELGASATIKFSGNIKEGFRYTADGGVTAIDENSIDFDPLTVEGKFGAYFVISPKISFCKFFTVAAMDLKGGVQCKATAKTHIIDSFGCLDLSASVVVSFALNQDKGIGEVLAVNGVVFEWDKTLKSVNYHVENGKRVDKCSIISGSEYLADIRGWSPSRTWTAGQELSRWDRGSECHFTGQSFTGELETHYYSWPETGGSRYSDTYEIELVRISDAGFENVNRTLENDVKLHQQKEVEDFINKYYTSEFQDRGCTKKHFVAQCEPASFRGYEGFKHKASDPYVIVWYRTRVYDSKKYGDLDYQTYTIVIEKSTGKIVEVAKGLELSSDFSLWSPNN